MRNRLTSFFINPNNKEQCDRLRAFAASFDHNDIVFNNPIVVFQKDDVWKGYFQICQCPTLFPAINWNTSSPRETAEMFDQMISWARIQHGFALVARPKDSKTFTPEICNKYGKLTPMNKELWEG